MSSPKPPALVKGLDYYLEGTKFVFTAAYHLKRGYCCNSKCRHCPYGGRAVQSASIQLVGLPLKPPIGGR